jgi:IS605 OrfB family transposase
MFSVSQHYLFIVKTYNIKLQFESKEDKQLLLDSLELKKQAFNLISKIRFEMDVCQGLKGLHDRCYYKIKEAIPTIPSQFIIKAEQDVVAKYQAIRKNKHQLEEAPQTDKLSINLDKRIYKWVGNDKIKLTTLTKRIVCNFIPYDKLNEMYAKYKLQDPSLFVKNNDIYLSVVFNDETSFIDNQKSIGFDLGIKRLVATSEGDIIKGNEFNTYKRKIRWSKRKLQSKQNHSHSARKKLNTLKRKEHNFSKNYIHHIVNTLLKNDANTIVIEDLSKIKSKNRGKKFNNRQSQVPYYLLKTILTYKAQSLGKRVEMVKPYFTSQNDHRGIESGKRKGCRYYASDGIILDADLNAANNIKLRGSKHSNSCCEALDGQVNVNSPIVGHNSGKPLSL